MNNKSKFLSCFVGIASIALFLFAGINNKSTYSISLCYTNYDGNTYYNSINKSKTGYEFLKELQDLNSQKLKHLVGYNNMTRNFSQTDYISSGSSKISAFYSGTQTTTKNINREHVWPNSHGGNLVEDDIHVIRPAIESENKSRGNSFYVEGMNDEYQGWDPANCGNASYRGDAARIIFYCMVAEPKFSLLDVSYHKTTEEDNDNMMGKLSDLIKWNILYPVTQREKNRNEAAEGLQGNRNPFIDHPEYVCKIWGDTNQTTRQLCEQHGGDKVILTGVSLDYSNLLIADNSDYTLTASHEPYNATNVSFSWVSSNFRVAAIDVNGKITPRSNGETTIRVVAEQDDVSYTAYCYVKIELNQPEVAPAGCVGNVVTTSIVLSMISILGVGAIIIKKVKKENRN